MDIAYMTAISCYGKKTADEIEDLTSVGVAVGIDGSYAVLDVKGIIVEAMINAGSPKPDLFDIISETPLAPGLYVCECRIGVLNYYGNMNATFKEIVKRGKWNVSTLCENWRKATVSEAVAIVNNTQEPQL